MSKMISTDFQNYINIIRHVIQNIVKKLYYIPHNKESDFTKEYAFKKMGFDKLRIFYLKKELY